VGGQVERGRGGRDGGPAGVIDHPRLRADLDADGVGEGEGGRGRSAEGPDAVVVNAGGGGEGGAGVGVGRRVGGEAGGGGREGRVDGALDVEAVVGHGWPGPGQRDGVGSGVDQRQDRLDERGGGGFVGEGRIPHHVGCSDLVEVDLVGVRNRVGIRGRIRRD